MRWGFEGMLQLQFRGTRLPISIGNLTVEFDGIKVSNLTLPKNYMVYIHGYHYIKNVTLCFQVVEMMNMNQYPLYSCYLVLIAVALVFILLYYLSLRFIKQKSSQDW